MEVKLEKGKNTHFKWREKSLESYTIKATLVVF
jgi:hypothetical protein